MPAKDTICAEMAFMFSERNPPARPPSSSPPSSSSSSSSSSSPYVRSPFDYPVGGSRAIVDALVRGIEKFGGRVALNSRVEEIVVEGGRASGVRVVASSSSSPSSSSSSSPASVLVRATTAVVSNASMWDTARLLPKEAAAQVRGGGSPPPSSPPPPPPSSVAELRAAARDTRPLPSFMHLHLGLDASGLPPGGAKEAHHLFVHDLFQSRIEEAQNVCILSVPTVFDPALAPGGGRGGGGGKGRAEAGGGGGGGGGGESSSDSPSSFAVVHAYTAGNEPYEIWENLDPRSKEYRDRKEERTQVLWVSYKKRVFFPPSFFFSSRRRKKREGEKKKSHSSSPPPRSPLSKKKKKKKLKQDCVERVIPDARSRALVSLSASPRTHERFLNRHRGSYGPGISAATSSFPGPKTGLPGLLRVGDSCAPGIGVPAAAASGMIAANTLARVWDHVRLLDSLGL